jgi:putative mycofactocin binding protein MftB
MLCLDRPYRLDPDVALRREPFGALAYHYRTRRLTFVRSQALVELLESLEGHSCLAAALEAAAPTERPEALRKALETLADSELICARG